MNRTRDYLQAFSSMGLGAGAFLALTSMASWAPLSSEALDAALFATLTLAANLAMALATRFAYRRLPHVRMRRRALQALFITILFVGILWIDLGQVLDSVALYTDSGVVAISELATMVTWVASFALVWSAFIAESENAIIAKTLTLLLALTSSALFFAEPLARFLEIDAARELSISKYALTCLALAVALSAFMTEWRSWKQQVNINCATSVELKERLPFLTHRQSRSIVVARHEHPFESVEQLRQVTGVDEETFRAISPHARI